MQGMDVGVKQRQVRAAALELVSCRAGRDTEPFSNTNRWSTLDTDAAEGCVRDVAYAYSADGGLAILSGNVAPDGGVVKTAGVRAENLTPCCPSA